MRNLINIAIVGCGGITSQHLRGWHKIDGARVVAVCDLNKLVAKETAKVWDIPSYFTDISEIQQQHSVSIIDICTPPKTHCQLAVQALELGYHVLVEKPLVTTTKEMEQVISASKTSGMKVGVIHNMLFEPVMIKALSLIRRGDLGQVINVDVRFLETNNEPMLSNKNHWCHLLSGGRFGEILPHPIYLLQALLGQTTLEYISTAKVGNYPWISADELYVVLKGDQGFGSIYVSFNSPLCATMINVYGTKAALKIDITDGTIIKLRYRPFTTFGKGVNNLRQIYQLATSISQAASLKLLGKWSNGHEACIRGFFDSIFNGKEPPVTLQEAYNTVETLERICQKIVSTHPRCGKRR